MILRLCTRVLVLLLTVYSLHRDQARALRCHCLNNQPCNEVNGFCSDGCEKGWYGPGCQVGNLALRKPAKQSSIYDRKTADLAVDGLVPDSGDEGTRNCSHTQETSGSPSWWYVTLSESEVFVIHKIMIVNRQGSNANCFYNFDILYTNDSAAPPAESSWTLCHHQASIQPAIRYTYQCKSLAVGRKVGISIQGTPGCNQKLTLCEVHIDGYSAKACPDGFVGPGCLLRSCKHNCQSMLCDSFDGCKFLQCPDQNSLPPACWIKTQDFSSKILSLTATCNTIKISMNSSIGSADISATSVVVSANAISGSHVQTVETALTASRILRASLLGSSNMSYSVRAMPVTCIDKSKCLHGMPEDCSAAVSCINGTSTESFIVQTGYRSYFLEYNGTCVTVTTESPNTDCEYPEAVQVLCQERSPAFKELVDGDGNITCGLKPGTLYNCSIRARFSTGLVETVSQYLQTEDLKDISTAIKSSDGALIGAVLGSFVVVALVTVVILVLKQRRISKRPTRDKIVLSPNVQHSTTENGEIGYSPCANAESDEVTYDNTRGMNAREFEVYVEDDNAIGLRFQELASNEEHPATVASGPGNKSKNRYKNIVPYDFNRVVLTAEDHGYINASYINGYSLARKYIAAQGPSLSTVDDFWRMVWQEKTTMIVMLTDYVEQSKNKCARYFPKLAGAECDISVTVQATTTYDTHIITVLNVQIGDEERCVGHYHYLSWRDQSVPEHLGDFLLFYSKISAKASQQSPGGPLVVHCSAGVGRTGAWIAFDYLMERFVDMKRIDVDSCVLQLRDQRMKMVQTKEQYVFLHRAALYALKTLRFVFDGNNLLSYIQEMSTPACQGNKILQEWEVLQSYSHCYSSNCDYSVASRSENSEKNRDSSILARDTKRTILLPLRGAPGDYINAVFCNGCYSGGGFVATQWPTRDTVTEFWQMVYQFNPSCIVVLHARPPGEEYPVYWPMKGKRITAGPLLVTDVSRENQKRDGGDDGARREFELDLQLAQHSSGDEKQEHRVTMLLLDVFKCGAELPTDTPQLLSVGQRLADLCKNSHEHPIIVQCSDGASHCGLFVAAMNSLHRLSECDQVQVFHTVDLLRASRPQFVRSLEQYSFIYEFLKLYQDSS